MHIQTKAHSRRRVSPPARAVSRVQRASSLDHAARALGQTAGGAMRRVHLPLIRPALGGAALLVFVDCMKELPATLLLRPLNFETLATHLYGEAARGTYEDGSVAATCIVLVGLIPVVMLARLSRRRAFAWDKGGGDGEAMARDLLIVEPAGAGSPAPSPAPASQRSPA